MAIEVICTLFAPNESVYSLPCCSSEGLAHLEGRVALFGEEEKVVGLDVPVYHPLGMALC